MAESNEVSVSELSVIFQPPPRQRGDLPNDVRLVQAIPSSWLVSRNGEALFVTESQSFLKWYVMENPGCEIEEVSGHVEEALARTGA